MKKRKNERKGGEWAGGESQKGAGGERQIGSYPRTIETDIGSDGGLSWDISVFWGEETIRGCGRWRER